MRSLPRFALWTLLVLAAPALSGCANFDPDNLDIFGLNEKKKLPGERKDVFPEGVPGVTQGIPQEYRMGAQTAAGADAAASAPQQPAAAPVEPEKPKPAPKRTVKRAAPKPAPRAAAAPVAPVQSQEAPAPQATQQQAPSSGWPAPAQGTTSSSGGAWPAPQPSGTFQR
ncbi:hypothetical protein [Undibacter mobilis]|uniref:Uncharacterized protein n=1 Tax=Undibacter mobilis TaxID=2292256 RepID=A0A371B2R2_9BRAD|nr:hypothetical protein [Undibacter mobilis]RDV01858.1 hypothetical protein DXH78_14635 [Undibacter mobilis]